MESLDALNRLIEIASSQRFSVSRIYFDILLKAMNNSDGLLPHTPEGGVPKSYSLDSVASISDRHLYPDSCDRIKNRICTLLQQIASFPNCFLNRISKTHLLELRRRLPDPAICAVLSKFAARGLNFAAVVASAGFADIVTRLDDATLPSFVDLLGSLAGFPELNAIIVPFFDAFVFPGIVSEDPRLIASSLAALGNLASNSREMLRYVAEYASLRVAFHWGTQDVEVAGSLLSFGLRVIEAGDASLLEEGWFISFLKGAFHLNDDRSAQGALRILVEILSQGFTKFVTEHGFDDIALTMLSSDVSFQVKRGAMVVLCMHFDQVTNTERAKYWERGIADVIGLAMGCTDEFLHEVAVRALIDLAALGEGTDNKDIADTANEICQDHNLDDDVVECVCRTEFEL
jgi:hypothetical protein